jgi:hypothetical protein
MANLKPVGIVVTLAGALSLGGCLVSDEPVLDESAGRATPIEAGVYIGCEAGEDETDCDKLIVSYDETGQYSFAAEDDDETTTSRFRRIARGAYAMQTREEEDNSYAYYYARRDGAALRLIFMQCPSLPNELRARLIERGDLSTDDEDFETCAVNTLRGLTEAAKAYHRGDAVDDEAAEMTLSPSPEVE